MSRPTADFVDLDYTQQVQAVKSSMYVVFNRLREKFVVMDRDINGAAYIFMVVQESDGSFRPFDERTMEIVRKAVNKTGYDAASIDKELHDIDLAREARIDKEAEEIEYGMRHDFKWAGVDVVQSVRARDIHRSPRRDDLHTNTMREAIRAVAR